MLSPTSSPISLVTWVLFAGSHILHSTYASYFALQLAAHFSAYSSPASGAFTRIHIHTYESRLCAQVRTLSSSTVHYILLSSKRRLYTHTYPYIRKPFMRSGSRSFEFNSALYSSLQQAALLHTHIPIHTKAVYALKLALFPISQRSIFLSSASGALTLTCSYTLQCLFLEPGIYVLKLTTHASFFISCE